MDLSVIGPWLVAAVLVAISLGAFFKGMTGLGLPLFAVPAIAMITSVEEAVVLMIIPGLGANLWLVVSQRRFRALLREHTPFLLAGFIGGIMGTFLLLVVDDRWLKLVLAFWLALYLIQYFLGDLLAPLFRARGVAAMLVGATGGTIQGATGISAHIVTPYFHHPKIKPEAYAFLIASTFLVFSAAQLSAALGTHLFTPDRLALSVAALVPTLLFTKIGISMAGKMSTLIFNRILLLTFLAMEVKLIADVL